jgi:hypothetical protein
MSQDESNREVRHASERHDESENVAKPACVDVERVGGGIGLRLVELLESVDAFELYRRCMVRDVSVAPGPVLSATGGRAHDGLSWGNDRGVARDFPTAHDGPEAEYAQQRFIPGGEGRVASEEMYDRLRSIKVDAREEAILESLIGLYEMGQLRCVEGSLRVSPLVDTSEIRLRGPSARDYSVRFGCVSSTTTLSNMGGSAGKPLLAITKVLSSRRSASRPRSEPRPLATGNLRACAPHERVVIEVPLGNRPLDHTPTSAA